MYYVYKEIIFHIVKLTLFYRLAHFKLDYQLVRRSSQINSKMNGSRSKNFGNISNSQQLIFVVNIVIFLMLFVSNVSCVTGNLKRISRQTSVAEQNLQEQSVEVINPATYNATHVTNSTVNGTAITTTNPVINGTSNTVTNSTISALNTTINATPNETTPQLDYTNTTALWNSTGTTTAPHMNSTNTTTSTITPHLYNNSTTARPNWNNTGTQPKPTGKPGTNTVQRPSKGKASYITLNLLIFIFAQVLLTF